MSATENTTQKYIIEYYKTSIDVMISWLLFQNSFGNLYTKPYLVVAPILENVRNQSYEDIKDIAFSSSSQFSINKIKDTVIGIIKGNLIFYGLEEVVPSLSTLSEDKFIELTTSLYIKRCLASTLNDTNFINKLEIKDDCMKFFKTFINTLEKLHLQSSMEHRNYSNQIIRFFIESLGIEYDIEKTSYSYIYQVLFYIKKSEHLIKELLESNGYDKEFEDTSEDFEILITEIDDYMKIDSLWSLIIIFHIFDHHLKILKGITKTEENILQKVVKSNN